MSDGFITDSLIARAAREFQKRRTASDTSVGTAFLIFHALATQPEANAAQLVAFVDDPGQIDQFIASVRNEYSQQNAASTEDLLKTATGHLNEITAGMKQSLTGQQQIQGDIDRLNIVATRLELASKEAGVTAAKLASEVEKVSIVTKQVRKNTSFWSAFFTGLGVGVLTGVPANIGTSYWYERHLSITAETAKNQVAEGGPPAPLPELVQPWPPTPAQGQDIVTWFRQNDSYTFKPIAPPAPVAHSPGRRPPTQHHRPHTPR